MNLLLIHSDQHRYDCLGSSGLRPDIPTPHLDALAANGTRFSHAFSTTPICTPARASLMTGAWPTTHGSLCIPGSELDHPARRELPILTRLLADNDYRIAWTGKYHGEMETPPGPEHGIEEFVGIGGPYYSNYRTKAGVPPLEQPNGFFGDVDSRCPSKYSQLAWQADHIIRQIRERRHDRFFVRWDPQEPHLPCNPTQEFYDRVANIEIPPWQSFPDPLLGKPAAQRRQIRLWGVEGWTWEHWLPVVRYYYAIIAELDHHIGRVLATLDEFGLADETMVIYSTDHGDYCGGHGQMDKHFNMYDDVLRVPLLLRHPGRIPAGAECSAFVSNSIDIARTCLEAGGVPAPQTFVGHDLVRMAGDPSFRPRRFAYSQYFGTESGAYSMRMLRDERFKFVYHPVGDRHEFYDLQNDPGELSNLIDDPAHATTIAGFKENLWNTMREAGDKLASHWNEVELCGSPSLAEKCGLPPLLRRGQTGSEKRNASRSSLMQPGYPESGR